MLNIFAEALLVATRLGRVHPYDQRDRKTRDNVDRFPDVDEKIYGKPYDDQGR